MAKNSDVQEMFDRIAHRYDLFNTVATLGRDGSWRRRTARLAAPSPVEHGLDAATGTGKLALALLKRAQRVTAFDFSERMLQAAAELNSRQIASGKLRLVGADAERMPFADDTFDCATIGFGLRNLPDVPASLREFLRVLKPGGRLAVMELSRPAGGPTLLLYKAAFKMVLPVVGRLISGDSRAYRYLPESVDRFATPQGLAEAMTAAGFAKVSYRQGRLNTVTFHVGTKPGLALDPYA